MCATHLRVSTLAKIKLFSKYSKIWPLTLPADDIFNWHPFQLFSRNFSQLARLSCTGGPSLGSRQNLWQCAGSRAPDWESFVHLTRGEAIFFLSSLIATVPNSKGSVQKSYCRRSSAIIHTFKLENLCHPYQQTRKVSKKIFFKDFVSNFFEKKVYCCTLLNLHSNTSNWPLMQQKGHHRHRNASNIKKFRDAYCSQITACGINV